MTFELNAFDDLFFHNFMESLECRAYKEFESDIVAMDRLLDDDEFVEAVQGEVMQGSKLQRMKKATSQAYKSTKSTTADVAGIYRDTTDAGASLIGGMANLTISSASLLSKILGFVCDLLGKIPDFIASTINFGMAIPDKVVSRIRGDVHLTITKEGIQLFKNSILPGITKVAAIGKEFASGSKWTDPKFFGGETFKKYQRLHKEMQTIYARIKDVKFDKTAIKVDTDEVRQYYFNTPNKKDATMTTYLGELQALILEMTGARAKATKGAPAPAQSLTTTLQDINKDIRAKVTATSVTNLYGQLKIEQQHIIQDMMKMISSVINILAKFTNEVNKDVKTILQSKKKIQEELKRADDKRAAEES